jgi:hypothetical protein
MRPNAVLGTQTGLCLEQQRDHPQIWVSDLGMVQGGVGRLSGCARVLRARRTNALDGGTNALGIASWRDISVAISRKFLWGSDQFDRKNKG